MGRNANNMEGAPLLTESGVDSELNARVFRVMLMTTVLSVFAAALLAPWRVSTGLLMGGILALFSHRWLQASVAAVVALAAGGHDPRRQTAKYIFRYLVIAVVALAGFKLRIASLPAIFAGLSSFVVAVFFEAAREIYFVIIQREEVS